MFRTEIRLKSPGWYIRYPDKFFCIGSCFAEHWNKRLTDSGFSSFVNPAGIVYNPLSLAHQLNQCMLLKPWTEEDIIFHQDLYHGLHHHGLFSSKQKSAVLEYMNHRLRMAHTQLLNSNILIITLGTALVFKHKPTGWVVANCHKIPPDQFERRFLGVEEIVDAFDLILDQLKSALPGLRIILTISPVRYLKEGFSDNSLSKSILILAAHRLIENHVGLQYYPAYEILLDDLRDYRFYKEDMIHPNDLAIDYIWSRFTNLFFEQDTLYIMDQINKLRKAGLHRPLHPESAEHKSYISTLDQKILELKNQYPLIVWE
ncbi:MAG: GSCFA domain-containing protein [Saprospiraceae bacterium]|nr:GSCFA domain-containing protein [Saprospiraceae bacterium]